MGDAFDVPLSSLGTYTSKLSFLTVTSITGDPSPIHNFSRKFNLGFNFVFSKTIQKRIICLIVTQSREYITSIMTKGLVTKGGIDR